MDETVVTATKTSENRKDIPNATIIIGKEEIKDSGAKSLGELLANEPGIDWRTQGNYGAAVEAIHIRGMGGDGTQVFINGINVNSPSLGSADLGMIDLNSIERIEIVKGAGSLLYGSGAMGGTINIITKEPDHDKMILRAGTGYGTNNAWQISGEQGMFATETLGYYLTANRTETDGFRDNSDLTQNDVSMKLLFDKGDFLKMTLYGDYLDRDYGLPGTITPEGTRDYFVNGVKFYNDESSSLVNRGSDENHHTAFNINGKPLQWLDFNLMANYSSLKGYNYSRYAAAAWPDPAGAGEKTWVTNEISTIESNFNIKPFSGVQVLLGGVYNDFGYENEDESLDGFGQSLIGSKISNDYSVYTRAAYVETQYRPCSYFKLIGGVRNEYHSMFNSINLPRYGFVINPVETTTLKLSSGKHFKAPTMNDLYWPDTGWTKGNTDLKPETGWHHDITLEQSLFSKKLFIDLSYFQWDIDNKINWAENPDVAAPVPGFFAWTPSNVDEYRAKGWEMGARLYPIKELMTSLSYTYADAKEKKDGGPERQAVNSADNLVKAGVTYWFNFGLTATSTLRYVGERPALYLSSTSLTPDYTLDDYFTMDVKLEQVLYGHWNISLQANNLFDEGFATNTMNFTDEATGVTTRQEYAGSGRSIYMNVSYAF